MRIIDGKLTNLAAFSGLSISVSGGVGGSVLATGRLPLGFAIALGSTLALAATLLLGGVVTAFKGLKPRGYQGVEESAAEARLLQGSLERDVQDAWASFAATLVVNLVSARQANDAKATAAIRTFWLVGAGFSLLVLAIVVVAVGSVV